MLLCALLSLGAPVPQTPGDVNCFAHCCEPCNTLSGNLTHECGACGLELTCRPGAPGYAEAHGRAAVRLGSASAEANAAVTAAAAGMVSDGNAAPAAVATAADAAGTAQPPAAALELCPTEVTQGQTGLQALPVIQRYCRRGFSACEETVAALQWHADKIQPLERRAAIIHREKPSVGAGFAHVLQEQAQVLLLGLVLGRPVRLRQDAGVFNRGGSLLGPAARAGAALFGPLADEDGAPDGEDSFATFLACRNAQLMSGRTSKLSFPYQCRRLEPDTGPSGGARVHWLPALADGDAWSVIQTAQRHGVWERFKHTAHAAPLGSFFPRSSFLISSPSVVTMYATDFVLADPDVDASIATHHRPPASELARGAAEFSGPACLVRSLLSLVAEPVLRIVAAALAPTTPPPGDASQGALLVGLHLRRGDARMKEECLECVNRDDPDVKSGAERVSKEEMASQLACLNTTLAAARAALGHPIRVFVASDTKEGGRLARDALGEEEVLMVPGTAVHSTTGRSRGGAAEKVAADFLALALADVVVSIGQSSFAGNAAAAGHSLVRGLGGTTGSSCELFTQDELAVLKRQMATKPRVHLEL